MAVSLPMVPAELKEKWVEPCIAQFFENLLQSTNEEEDETRVDQHIETHCKGTLLKFVPRRRTRRPTGVSKILPKAHQVLEEAIWSYRTKASPPGIEYVQCIHNGMNSCIVNIDNDKCWNVEHYKQPQPSFLVHAGSGLVSPRRRLVLHRTDSWKSDVHRWYMQPLCITVIQLGKVGENHGCPWVFSPQI